jgi:RNA polymerase sigma factor (sigma-70 family)
MGCRGAETGTARPRPTRVARWRYGPSGRPLIRPANTLPVPLVCESVLGHVMTATLSTSTSSTTDAAGPVGNIAADRLGTLFDAHHQRLYKLARRLSPTADDARDLVQETFLRAARSMSSVPAGNEEAWLVRVLVNIQRDEWRRKSAKKRIDPERQANDARAESSNHETAFIAKTMVWRALEQLDPRRRTVIVMYELEGATIPAIAQLLGVTAVTVRWHLSMGRRELADAITNVEARGQRLETRG